MSYRTSFPPTRLLISDSTEKDFTQRVPSSYQQPPRRISTSRPVIYFPPSTADSSPFVYAHKYSFKPPHNGTTAGRSVSRHSSGIINRPSIVSKLPPVPLGNTFHRGHTEYLTDKNRVVRFQERHLASDGAMFLLASIPVGPFHWRICGHVQKYICHHHLY